MRIASDECGDLPETACAVLRIVTICSSVRPDNDTSKALAIVDDALRKHSGVEVIEIDLERIALPLPGKAGRDSTHEAPH